jgi:hypothetical protein
MNSNKQILTNSTTRAGWPAERRAFVAMAAFFGITLLLGTFLDETIAKALYTPRNAIVTVITTLGIYPFSAAVVLFMGVACERIAHGTSGKVAKTALAAATGLIALVVGFVGGASLVDADCLGSIVPALNRNYLAITVLSLVVEWPLFYVGWRLATRNDDRSLFEKGRLHNGGAARVLRPPAAHQGHIPPAALSRRGSRSGGRGLRSLVSDFARPLRAYGQVWVGRQRVQVLPQRPRNHEHLHH